MGMDGFGGNNSDSSSGKPDGENDEGSGVTAGSKVKEEAGEPVAGTSKDGTAQQSGNSSNPAGNASTPKSSNENEYMSSGKSLFFLKKY